MKSLFVLLATLVVVSCDINVKNYLNQFGYLPDTSSINDEKLIDAIKKYQHTFGLDESGVIDEETLKLMSTPRCGLKDHGHGNSAANDRGWHRKDLSYYFYNYTPDLHQAVVEERTARALQYWSDVTPLNFTRQEGGGDIVVAFGAGRHRDDRKVCRFPFDGPGGVLAHAFFPNDGRIHFDEDETYTVRSAEGINYLWVATHEMGHIMGLEHDTVNRDAVMYPYYRPYNPKGIHLHANDIRRIQALYGKHGGKPITHPQVDTTKATPAVSTGAPPPVTTKAAPVVTTKAAPVVTTKATPATTKTPGTTDRPLPPLPTRACKDTWNQCASRKDKCKGATTAWTEYMKRYCMKTCGYCEKKAGTTKATVTTDRPLPTQACKDTWNQCVSRKNMCKGQGQAWTDYMKKYCMRTCGYCGKKIGTTKATVTTDRPLPPLPTQACKDVWGQCVSRKQMCHGQSAAWTDYMKKYCKKTCGYCGKVIPVTTKATPAVTTKSHGATTKSHGDTTKSHGHCTPSCHDVYLHCKTKIKKCKNVSPGWTAYMKENCNRTCKYCCYKPA